MKTRFAVLALVAILFTFTPFAEASQPACRLGGPTAMDPNRLLAEGETFVYTDRALVVNLQYKPTKEFPYMAGECMLPPNQKVAVKNGYIVWVAECGNNELNRNIPMGPQPVSLAQAAERVITDPRQGNISVVVNNMLPPYERGVAPIAPNYCSGKKNNCDDGDGPNWSKRILIGLGAAAVGYAVYHFTKDKAGPPGAKTNPIKPTCTGVGCPGAPGTGAGFSFSW